MSMDYDEIFKDAEKEVVEKYRSMGGNSIRRNNNNHSCDRYVTHEKNHPMTMTPNINVTVNPVIHVVSKERQKNSPLTEVGRMIGSFLPILLK